MVSISIFIANKKSIQGGETCQDILVRSAGFAGAKT
jgi:hypothetical protein